MWGRIDEAFVKLSFIKLNQPRQRIICACDKATDRFSLAQGVMVTVDTNHHQIL